VKAIAFCLALLMAQTALAQESRIASDWRRERERIAENCSELAAKKLADCAVTLVTDYPFHLAFGSLAPRNGFALGLAFVERYAPNEDWRISFNADAVAAISQSWRAGGYMTFVRSKVALPTVSTGAVTSAGASTIHEYPVFRAYAQHIVLNELIDFGPDFDAPRETLFGESQTIAGGSGVLPLNLSAIRALGLSVIGGVHGRFVSIHEAESDAFVELFEDLRAKPSLLDGRLRFNYSARFQQFLGDSALSFRRWTADLRHEIPIYRSVPSTGPADFNGPDDCSIAPGSGTCPPLTFSRNRSGSIGVRLLTVSSTPFDKEGGSVPFYFQPTLGGSDINGQRLLASYEDYRFRAPHVLVLQASIEHSIWGPLGAFASAERGKAVQRRDDLDFNNLLDSYSAGLSIRAGGAPVINAAVAWGGSGRRVIVTMDTSLLGGSSRPSLY
jgi:hypothetical protein